MGKDGRGGGNSQRMEIVGGLISEEARIVDVALMFGSLGAALGFWAGGAILSLAKTAFISSVCDGSSLFIGFLPAVADFPAAVESFVR